MKKLTVQDRAVEIKLALRDEQEAALTAVKGLFPIGSRVRIKANNPRGYFRLEVTRHGCSWHDPLTVYGINTITRRDRRFYVGADEVLDVELPAEGGEQ